MEPAYPRELEGDISLTDGTIVHVRPIRPSDQAGLMEFSRRLSAETVYLRFFRRLPALPPEWAHHFANVDYRDRLALVAEIDGVLIAVVRYEGSPEHETMPEVALLVEDRWQGHGLGGILLDRLLEAAAARGLEEFQADVLAENHRMLDILAHHTEVTRRKTEQGGTEVRFRRRNAGPANGGHDPTRGV